jgi:hypothetical protein
MRRRACDTRNEDRFPSSNPLKRQQTKSTRRVATASDGSTERGNRLRAALRGVVLAGLVAIYVARPLLPSESPTTVAGDGLPFVMLTLILSAIWLLGRLAEPRPAIRFGFVEALWVSLLAWQATSTYSTTQSGYARAAINTFWEWAGLGLSYLLLRQLRRTDSEKRAVCVVMIGLALVLSSDGVYQFFIENPANRVLYWANPDRALQEQGIDAPAGSTARYLFEQRLASSEPTATFALANSLAGFLTPWLLMTIALGWLADGGCAGAPLRGRNWIAVGVCAVAMAMCLMQTKSRAGLLALIAGIVALVLLRGAWRLAVAATVLISVIVAIGFASGALDRQVLTEAFKSMSYRLHYWHGALAIAREHPWFGCGPGNFQDEYTRFKLPEASEVVADPHNFALEVGATCGLPALVALLVIFIAAAAESRSATASGSQARTDPEPPSLPLAPVVGGIAGFFLASAFGLLSTVGLPSGVLLMGLAVLPLLTFAFSAWIRAGAMPPQLPLLSAAALLVNLLAAGGIGFAGVAGSLWLLLALGDGSFDQAKSKPRWAVACLCGAALVLMALCHVTAYGPVLECKRLLGEAAREPGGARQSLVAAAEADRWSDEPWSLLAAGDFDQWLRQPDDKLSDRWQHDYHEVLMRRPHSSAAWLAAAENYWSAYQASEDFKGKQEYLAEAVRHFRRAVELYPNSPRGHARLALALAAAKLTDAATEAAIALRLHEQTPHLDQKLPDGLAADIKALARTHH